MGSITPVILFKAKMSDEEQQIATLLLRQVTRDFVDLNTSDRLTRQYLAYHDDKMSSKHTEISTNGYPMAAIKRNLRADTPEGENVVIAFMPSGVSSAALRQAVLRKFNAMDERIEGSDLLEVATLVPSGDYSWIVNTRTALLATQTFELLHTAMQYAGFFKGQDNSHRVYPRLVKVGGLDYYALVIISSPSFR